MKFNYDKEHDILSIHKGFSANEKFKGNIDVGELILDLSTKGKIRGIEIMDATKYLGIQKSVLKQMEDAQFKAVINKQRILISLALKQKGKTIPAKIAVPLEVGF